MADMTLDLTDYFARIGYRGAADPTLDVLQDVITAHTRAIAFENLDPLLGVPVDDLGPEALFDKLVRRRRGGYCYEHNGLMGCVLAELGFGVRRFAARVVWTVPPGLAGAVADAHVAGGGTGKRAATFPRRRGLRRPDADVTASAGNRQCPADDP
jgi:arylamine N-acetyltransferase